MNEQLIVERKPLLCVLGTLEIKVSTSLIKCCIHSFIDVTFVEKIVELGVKHEPHLQISIYNCYTKDKTVNIIFVVYIT